MKLSQRRVLTSQKHNGKSITPAVKNAQGMHPAYFETQFECAEKCTDWPDEFAMITAYATTGEKWSGSKNQAADKRLKELLLKQRLWFRRVTGFCPASGHREPGWAVYLGFKSACEVGLRFKQDAIYYVAGDILNVSYTDSRRALVRIGSFRQRVNFDGSTNRPRSS